MHPDDPDRKLTPQLHGVAAWLAVLHGEIFNHVVEHEPELLLLSDVVVEGNDDRARIVGELLRRKRAQQLARIDVLAYPRFRKLAHPGIAEQLRLVLMNVEEPEELRELAADIAEYTECATLIPELTQIALDSAQLRMQAEGEPLREALLDAGIVRLRPVLITVGATVLGLFPLASHGGPLWEALCYAQIGGLLMATALTLLLVPVIYAICVLDLRIVKWPGVAETTTPQPEPAGVVPQLA